MWSAFFGGPLAAAAMIGINAWRVGRVRRDVVWVVLIAIAYLAWTFFLEQMPGGADVRQTLVSWLGSRGPVYFERFLSLMVFLGGMLLHRAEQRSADLFALKRPNGWIMGVALIAFGFAASALLVVGMGK